MNPKDFYRKLSFSIKDAEIRAVAAVMCEHIGEENAVRLEALASRVSMDDRKVRIILRRLRNEFGLPVCSISGKAGYWLARSLSETKPAEIEFRSRARENIENANAYQNCQYPPKQVEELCEVQPALIEVEPEYIPYWRW
jgi:DNA-binding IscR family transcriptional regulator